MLGQKNIQKHDTRENGEEELSEKKNKIYRKGRGKHAIREHSKENTL